MVDKATQKAFLIAEYQEISRYLINVENSMPALLRLYNSVVAVVVPVSAVLFKFRGEASMYPFFTALALVVFLLGWYILGMYIELRIRKIKTLEQLAVYRENLIRADPTLSHFLKMITSVRSCPPYLRRPSSEWYTVVYISSLTGFASMVAVFSALRYMDQLTWLTFAGQHVIHLFWVLPLTAFFVAGWRLFIWSTHYCHIYDLKREQEYGVRNEYSFLNPGKYFPTLFKPLRWLAARHENRMRSSEVRYEEDCEFCQVLRNKQDLVYEDSHSFCKWDQHPVSEGHMLVIPKSHVTSFFALSVEQILSIHRSIAKGKEIIEKDRSPGGYNLGVNIGGDAGQTIAHLHVHLIPRYRGDVANPEGGIRNIMPGKGEYKKKMSH